MVKRSFAVHVKEEICTNKYESLAVKKAILSSFIRINGTILIRNKRSFLTLNSQNAKIIKFIYQLINDVFPCNPKIDSFRKGKGAVHHINIDYRVDDLLTFLDVSFLEGKIPKSIVYDDETIAGYLLGAFLACGSVNSPETSNYHLEFSLNNENYAKWLSRLFARYKNNKIEPKVIERRNRYIVYFKKSDQIADFLVMIGAMSSAMDFENFRIDRDYMNNAYRLENLDTANMSRTIEAGKRQANEIKYLEKRNLLSYFTDKKAIRVIELRKEYLSRSLDDIAMMVSKELGINMTKSNVNHILRKVHELYIKEKR